MSDRSDRLRAALADRYTLERELGRGGMAIVYLAQDLRHARQVALKVLRPELAQSLGGERFLREIQLAAQLNHPHILPLHDSGQTDGVLWYTMPYVEGESLRDRLTREGQLPIDEALRITQEVADGLGYAHTRGILHRDIKPENILLSEGHAVIADFGIATAVTEAGGERLTETGIAVGTPTYMSPEQGAGSAKLDARSDLYGLACVLYEMLAGEAPYTGPSAQAVIAKKLADPVPHITRVREAVPQPVDAALVKALAKVPADRYGSLTAFAAALQVDLGTWLRGERVKRWAQRAGIAAVALLAVGGSAVGYARYRVATDWKRRDLDAAKIAVLPFNVTATDASMASLLEDGVPDLMYATLTTDMGFQTVETEALLRKRAEMEDRGEYVDLDAPRRLAAHFGAGRVLSGRMVQADSELVVNAWLHDVRDGEELASRTLRVPASRVFSVLAGRLARELLGDELGEHVDRLNAFARYDPEAVKAYLAGVRAERDGNPVQALSRYLDAAALDVSFALPVLRNAHVRWQGIILPGETGEDWHRSWTDALVRARSLRDALGPRDQALLWLNLVIAGAYVDSVESSVAILNATRRWASLAPDDPDAHIQLARMLLYGGAISQQRSWETELQEARERAWAIDSVTPKRINAQAGLALMTGDREWAARVLPAFVVKVDSTSERWAGVRWGLAHLLGDSATVRGFRARARAGDPSVVSARTLIEGFSFQGHVPLHDAQLLVDQLHAPGGDTIPLGRDFRFALPLGRVQLAARGLNPYNLVELAHAYGGLEASAGARAAQCESALPFVTSRLTEWNGERCRRSPLAMAAAWLEADPDPEPGVAWNQRWPDPPPTELRNRCWPLLYRARLGDTLGVRELARQLMPRFHELHLVGICPAMVEAFVESHDTIRADTPALDMLESLMRTGPGFEMPASIGMLAVTRLARARGQLERALEAAGDGCCWGAQLSAWARAPLLQEEGELAAILGDTTRAIDAFVRYLNIRVDPDPGYVQNEVDSVRTMLTRLRGGER